MDENENIWLRLAELFFLDQEVSDLEIRNFAKILREKNWNKEKTKKNLIEIVAPVAGSNVGYLLWPVIGTWNNFNEQEFIKKCHVKKLARAKHSWRYFLSDWYCQKMLYKLGVDRLLDQLAEDKNI